MPQLISTDLGQVKVGGTILPGIFESLEISGSVKMDQVEIKGKQEKSTQAVGYENARVRLNLVLQPKEEGGDCSEQIAVLQKIFRKSNDQEKPGVYQFINKHTAARNISQVIFSELRTFEDNRSDKVIATCEFIEHIPIKVQVVTKTAAAKPKPKTTPAKPSGFGDLRKAELTQSKASVADLRMMDNKLLKTPAKDNREPSTGQKILAWLRGENNA